MLSKQALALSREHMEQRRKIDLEANQEAYPELARAGLMSLAITSPAETKACIMLGRSRKPVSLLRASV